MKLNPESIARASSRKPWIVIAAWFVLLMLAIVATRLFLADALTTDFDFTDQPESKRAQTLVEDRLRGPETYSEIVVVTSTSGSAADDDFMAYIGELTGAISGIGSEKIAGAFPVGRDGQPQISSDGKSQLITVILANSDLDEAAKDAETLHETIQEVGAPSGVEAKLFGQGTVTNDFQHLAEEGLQKGESIGVGVALIVLLVVIGTAVAAGLPILLAIAAILVAIGITALVGQSFDLSFFVVNFITMIGLAVGIDYALFIVARYREERAKGNDEMEAIGRAGATANRAVFFSGMTVVLALIGMLFVPNTIFRSLGLGAIFVVLIAVAASMTLLPAVIALLGDRINFGKGWSMVRRSLYVGGAGVVLLGIGAVLNSVTSKVLTIGIAITALGVFGVVAGFITLFTRDLAAEGGMWDKITHAVMGRPVAWLVGAAALMLLLAWPFLSMETGFSGISTLPERLESRQAFDILATDFGFVPTEPIEIVADGPVTAEVEAAFAELAASMESMPIFGQPAQLEVKAGRDLALLSVPLTEDVQGGAAATAVEDLRNELVPMAFDGTGVEVLVGGTSGFNVDFFDDVTVFTPIVFVFVLGLSFLLLTVVFRSIVLPVKAIILNLLSVAAAYGAVTLFFQDGVGPGFIKDVSPFLQVEQIEAWLPLFLFAVLFGLSMDYHVFLLTRIREHFDKTGDNTLSVAHGLRTTGAIITGAAAIMVAVFGGFALGELVPLQQMGFGLAVAVFLDATIVRSILVPASMRLLGEYNWYLPKWLDWLPHIDIEGHEAAAAAEERVKVGTGVGD